MTQKIDLLHLIADDKNQISYRPRWNIFTGGVNGTIFLQQVIYRWVQKNRQPFYKFSRPCKSHYYRPGDSWEEELGMTRREFETARKKVSAKTQGERNPDTLISFWSDRYHRTWYAVNEPLVVAELIRIYPGEPEATVGVQGVLVMADSAISPQPTEPNDLPAWSPILSGESQEMAKNGDKPGENYPIIVTRVMADSAITPTYPQPATLVAESAICTDGQNRHSPMDESANSTNVQNEHSPMAESCSGNTQRQTSENNNKEKTTVENKNEPPPISAATGPASTSSLFAEIGIVGRPTVWYRNTQPDLLLAWIWSTLLETMEPNYVPGFIVNQLKAKTDPPSHLTDLTRRWLKLDFTDREILRAYADNFQPDGHLSFADDVPEEFLSDLYSESLNAFYKLYRSHAVLTDF